MSRAPKKPLPPADGTRFPKRTRAAGARPRTLVVCPRGLHEPSAQRTDEGRLAEAVGLAAAIDLRVTATEMVTVRRPRPATLFGSGWVRTIGEQVAAEGIELVVVDAALSAIQQRNLERAWSCKVIDRTGLILEIFGARARTREGRLQVELAALTYQRSRLVRSWTHLERQRGGFGFLGGPGESQIELDRRRIDDRIIRIRRDLDAVKRTRGLHRAARERVPYPVIALVGYTNAGKSTLFNRLTGAAVSARDRLFATLDPTMRVLSLPSGRPWRRSGPPMSCSTSATSRTAKARRSGRTCSRCSAVSSWATSPTRGGCSSSGTRSICSPRMSGIAWRPLPPAGRTRPAARRARAMVSTICWRLWTGRGGGGGGTSGPRLTMAEVNGWPGCSAPAPCATAGRSAGGPSSGLRSP